MIKVSENLQKAYEYNKENKLQIEAMKIEYDYKEHLQKILNVKATRLMRKAVERGYFADLDDAIEAFAGDCGYIDNEDIGLMHFVADSEKMAAAAEECYCAFLKERPGASDLFKSVMVEQIRIARQARDIVVDTMDLISTIAMVKLESLYARKVLDGTVDELRENPGLFRKLVIEDTVNFSAF